jgi:phosphoenolpyruvate-protein kinase (PTS system EI component)
MIPRVRSVLSQIKASEAREIATKCLAAGTAEEVEEHVRNEFKGRWPELFPPNALPKTPESSE